MEGVDVTLQGRRWSRTDHCSIDKTQAGWSKVGGPGTAMVGFEDDKGGHKPRRCRQFLQDRKHKEKDSPLESLKEMQLCSHLDFSPARPILDLTTEL